MAKSNGRSGKAATEATAITSLTIAGFKSIVDEQTLEIRPLTLLAGANSSGKSSMMQPLLLLKQTLEATYDPGPLLLNGPNVKFTSVGQFWPSVFSRKRSGHFNITIGASNNAGFGVAFRRNKRGIEVDHNVYYLCDHKFTISADSSAEEVGRRYAALCKGDLNAEQFRMLEDQFKSSVPALINDAFFRSLHFSPKEPLPGREQAWLGFSLSPQATVYEWLVPAIVEVIHLPGLRGIPARTFPLTAVGPRFLGTFENYVASLISHWSKDSPSTIKDLGDDLKALGLTWKIVAKPLDDTQVELQVGRMPHPKRGGAHDMVSIADVGVGVSQVLPVVVALRAANPGQLVYIEQPEIHLHPRAQAAMARLLVNAAKRGVRVVAETHSSLILLAVQTLVAEGVIDPELVGLNWFIRSEKDGTTRIQSATLDEAGRFGDWPEDFDAVALETENRYLAAAEERLAQE